MIKKILIPFILVLSQAFGQVNASFQLNGYYDDNLYRSPSAESDFLTEAKLGLSYDISPNWSLYATPSYFAYRENYLRNFTMLTAGLNGTFNFGNNSEHRAYAGMDWDWRINDDTYDYYDFQQLYTYLSGYLKFNWFYLKTGYNFRYRNYLNFEELSNYRHYLFAQVNKSFQTRTSLFLEADLGYKSFAGSTEYISGGGKGYGRQSSMNTGTANISSTIPSLSHFIYLVRIAQSLHDRVGLNAQFRQQIALETGNSFVNSSTYFRDEELFDDPFGYESSGLSSTLTWMMPWNMQFRVNSNYSEKSYTTEQAFADAQDTTGQNGSRSDIVSAMSIRFTKRFFPRKKFLKEVRADLQFGYLRNESNSYWYDYRNSWLNIGLQFSL